MAVLKGLPSGGFGGNPMYQMPPLGFEVAPAPVSVAGVRDAVAPTAGGTKPNYISLTKDIAKQKKLAEALSAIGNTQYDDQEYGGIVVPRSPLSLLTSAAGNFGGAYLDAEADTKEAKLKADKMAAALAQFGEITGTGTTEEPINVDDVVFDLDQQTTIIPKSSGRFAPTNTLPEQRKKLVEMLLGADDNEYAQQYAKLGLENVDYGTRRRDVADQAAADEKAAAEGKRRYDATAAALAEQNKATNQYRADQLRAQADNRNVRPVPTRGAADLMTASGLYDISVALQSDFQPEFAELGFLGQGGDQAVAFRKTYDDNDPAAAWWTAYSAKAGQIRNNLYGASLTNNEIAEWNKVAVNPNMKASTIKNNLELQRQIEENAMYKNVRSLLGSGYSPESIEGAAGNPIDYYKYNKLSVVPASSETPATDEAAAIEKHMNQWDTNNPGASDEDRREQELEFRAALEQ